MDNVPCSSDGQMVLLFFFLYSGQGRKCFCYCKMVVAFLMYAPFMVMAATITFLYSRAFDPDQAVTGRVTVKIEMEL